MNNSNLLEKIEQLRKVMENRGRVEPLNGKELLRLSERLDWLINVYHNRGRKQEVRGRKKD